MRPAVNPSLGEEAFLPPAGASTHASLLLHR